MGPQQLLVSDKQQHPFALYYGQQATVGGQVQHPIGQQEVPRGQWQQPHLQSLYHQVLPGQFGHQVPIGQVGATSYYLERPRQVPAVQQLDPTTIGQVCSLGSYSNQAAGYYHGYQPSQVPAAQLGGYYPPVQQAGQDTAYLGQQSVQFSSPTQLAPAEGQAQQLIQQPGNLRYTHSQQQMQHQQLPPGAEVDNQTGQIGGLQQVPVGQQQQVVQGGLYPSMPMGQVGLSAPLHQTGTFPSQLGGNQATGYSQGYHPQPGTVPQAEHNLIQQAGGNTRQPTGQFSALTTSLPVQHKLNEPAGMATDILGHDATVDTSSARAHQPKDPMSDRPTLTELLAFDTHSDDGVVNIAELISTRYIQFGADLLDDHTGSRILNIEHARSKNPELINQDILSEWLQGKGKKPVTWKTLATALNDSAELGELVHKHIRPLKSGSQK